MRILRSNHHVKLFIMFKPSQFSNEHPVIPNGKIAVVLVNLGTPERPTRKSIRQYLSEFLSDGRVIELPRLLWYPILYGIILNIRPQKLAAKYAAIWDKERDVSPLAATSIALCEKLRPIYGDKITIDWAMCYGSKHIEQTLSDLQQSGHDRIIFLSLYPQYSATTTAAAVDKALLHMLKSRWQPAMRISAAYYDHDDYIDAVADSVTKSLEQSPKKIDKLVFSFHGLPQRYFDAGDPYHCHCYKTARLISEKLNMGKDDYVVSFQSRFGREKWLTPYTSDMMEELPKQGIKNIAMIAPGFSADCLETLEEIKDELCEEFIEAGGEHFHYIPCLNDSDGAIRLYKSLIDMDLKGWID